MFKYIRNLKIPKILTTGIVANTCFGTFLRVNADIVQQNIENKSLTQNKLNSLFNLKELDVHRTLNIGKIGIVIGPFMYLWYSYLDRILPGKCLITIAKKIFLDQLVGGIGFIFIFINGLCLMDGMSFSESFNEFLAKFPFIYMVS